MSTCQPQLYILVGPPPQQHIIPVVRADCVLCFELEAVVSPGMSLGILTLCMHADSKHMQAPPPTSELPGPMQIGPLESEPLLTGKKFPVFLFLFLCQLPHDLLAHVNSRVSKQRNFSGATRCTCFLLGQWRPLLCCLPPMWTMRPHACSGSSGAHTKRYSCTLHISSGTVRWGTTVP